MPIITPVTLFRHRPADKAGLLAVSIAITLGDDLAVMHHDHGAGFAHAFTCEERVDPTGKLFARGA